MLIRMTPDDIINRDAAVARNLGTVKKISAANSREFGKAIGEYIDSKEKKRGKKDDEKKSKSDGPAVRSLLLPYKLQIVVVNVVRSSLVVAAHPYRQSQVPRTRFGDRCCPG